MLPKPSFSPLKLALPKLVLLINHVLSQEPEAMSRLKVHAGKSIQAHLPALPLPVLSQALGTPEPVCLTITPAGLLELANAEVATLTVSLSWPKPDQVWTMLKQKQRPPMQIEGDAQLAEVVAWIAQNIRWDMAADLQHWFGLPLAASFDTAREHVMQTAKRWQAGRSQGSQTTHRS